MIGHRWRRLVSLFILSAAAAGAEPLADPGAPLAGMVALYNTDRARLGGGRFPLENAATDTLCALDGLQRNAVVKWLDPLTFANAVKSDRWSQRDVDTYIRQQKRQLGGYWLRVVQDVSTGAWRLDRGAPNRRYDATSATRLRVTGTKLSGLDHDDAGRPLPAGVVAGIMAD